MMASIKGLLATILPKKKTSDAGVASTGTFRPNSTSILPVPAGRDHLTDLFTTRQASDAKTLLKSLFQQDPDVSAAVNAYCTVADVEPYWVVKDPTGVISRDGHKVLEQQILPSLFTRTDYTIPSNFALKQSLKAICADLRYMALLRGGIGCELVMSKQLLPTELRNVDMGTIQWKETKPGVYLPQQLPAGSSTVIPLDIPTFFTAFFRRDPTEIYTSSFFVSAINTIAARQQVINDLYRIMKFTGFPRIAIELLEEVLRNNAPADCKADESKMILWLWARRQEVLDQISSMTAEQAIVHYDSMKPSIFNAKNPSNALDITAVIETLNAQNQAALKVMAVIIGRGDSGVNTATVEARIFALNAEQLNNPIADLMSQVLTLAVRLSGVEATVEFNFERIEMRFPLELEAQLTMRQTRYLEMLSLGIITDDEFSLEMFNRITPDGAVQLSGTNFLTPTPPIDASSASPNADPLGKSLTPKSSKQAKSN